MLWSWHSLYIKRQQHQSTSSLSFHTILPSHLHSIIKVSPLPPPTFPYATTKCHNPCRRNVRGSFYKLHCNGADFFARSGSRSNPLLLLLAFRALVLCGCICCCGRERSCGIRVGVCCLLSVGSSNGYGGVLDVVEMMRRMRMLWNIDSGLLYINSILDASSLRSHWSVVGM